MNETNDDSNKTPLKSNNSSSSSTAVNNNNNNTKHYFTKLPWGVLKEKPNLSSNLINLMQTNVNNVNQDVSLNKIEKKKPGEYLMHLVVFNFIEIGSKKLDQIVNGDKRDKRLKECFNKNEDQQFDKLITTMGQVAEHCLPSLIRTLLLWHEAQINNLNYLKMQNQQQSEFNAHSTSASSKITLKAKQHLLQAKIENEILDERKELVVHSLMCTSLIEILKQLPFHPGIDDLLNYIIDLSFQRFLSKDILPHLSSYVQHNQLYLDNQYVTDLFAECIGVIAHSRFSLVRRRFAIEFTKLKLNISPLTNQVNNINTNVQPVSTNISNLATQSSNSNQSIPNSNSLIQLPGSLQQNNLSNLSNNQATGATSNLNQNTTSNLSAPNLNQQQTALISPTSSNIIKLLMGMKYFRIKMVPIEDFEASFQFLNDCALYFVEVKDKDIKHTLAGLFVEILVPITGIVKNEVNVPCLKSFVDILYQHAWELSAKTKHRLATIPLLTCLLCVSQKQFFLNYWFQFAQLCFQQLKSKEQTLSRLALESILRLVWIYMIRIKGEKSNDTNQRLTTIIQSLFPRGNKLVIPKEMPANIYVKIINYIAYEKLDFAFKEIIYELLSIDVNSSNSNSNNSSDQIDSNQINSSNLISNNNINNNSSSNQQASLNSNQSQSEQKSGLNSSNTSSAYKTSKDNLIIVPLRMEIGLKAFVLIADTLQQQKEIGLVPPNMPSTFNTPNNDILSVYLNKTNNSTQRVTLTDTLAKEIGLGVYFEHIRRAFQDILKTLDFTIGRTFLMTRPDNTNSFISTSTNQLDAIDSSTQLGSNSTGLGSSNPNSSNLNLPPSISSSNTTINSTSSLLTIQTNSTNLLNSNTDVSSNQLNNKTLEDINSSNLNITSKDLIFNSDNKSRLSLFRTCIALIPRIMPMFKETEIVDILTRLTIHLDDELKLISFQTLKILVNDYPQWRKCIFTSFTSFILKEISETYPKLIENSLKMLIQLINQWRTCLNSNLNQNLDDCCQIIFHLEGFSLFNLCHSHVQRRRFALIILKECKSIGELTKCFKFYPFHNYTLDVLDLASISCMKQLHLQCFNSSLILTNQKPDLAYLIDQSVNWDTSINTANYNNNNNSNETSSSNLTVNSNNTSQVNNSAFYLNIINKNQRAGSVSSSTQNTVNPSELNNESNESTPSNSVANNSNQTNQQETETQTHPILNQTSSTSSNNNSSQTGSTSQSIQINTTVSGSNSNIFTFDPWTECLAIFFSYDFVFTKCPQPRVDAWPFIYARLQQLLPFVDPNEQPHEMSRTSILFGVGSNSLEKIRRAVNERDINLNLWKNYLISACCLTSGSDRYLYYQEYEKALIKTDELNDNLNLNLLPSSLPTATTTITNTSAINVDFTIVESTSKFYTTFGTATSLIKMIVPFLKCECNYFREIIIRGLGRINIEAMRDLIEELVPFIKDSLDKRQEKMRRMKKKDFVRLCLVRIFELMAEQKTLGKRIIDTIKKSSQLRYQNQSSIHQTLSDEQQLRKTFNDYIEGMHFYLDQESDKVSDLIVSIRLHFSLFLHKLVDSIPKEKRNHLFTDTTRYNLFYLCDKWSGRFSLMQHGSLNGSSQTSSTRLPSTSLSAQTISQMRSNPNHLYMHQNHYHHHNCYHYYEELELGATKACAAILCCGNTFEYLSNKNSIAFTWLSQLIENANIEMKMYDNCKSTLPNEIYMISLSVCVQLLELSLYNISLTQSSNTNLNIINLSLNNSPVFEWVIQKCYSSVSQETADLCYIALGKVYLEYLNNLKQTNNNLIQTNKINSLKTFDSIYLGPILTLILLNIGSTKSNIHETSVCLLRALNKNFLQDNFNLFDSKDIKKQNESTELNNSKTSTLSSLNNNSSNTNPTIERQESIINSFLNIDFDIINSMAIYSKSQAFISEYIAKKNPEQTMFIFCEITSRFEQCTAFNTRRSMLNILVPWFYNLELIDPNVISNSDNSKSSTVNNLLSLQSGYGSQEGTNLILNNLFYLTCKFGDQFSTEFELLWAILASTWRSNLKIICRYIFVMISLAPYEVLTHGKKIICYLSKVCQERIVDELITELELFDCFSSILDKCENNFPYYKYNRPATIPPSPPPSPKQEEKSSNHKKSSIYFVNQDDDDEEDEIDDESIEFINQSDFNNFDEEDDDDYDSDDYEEDENDSSDNEQSEPDSDEEKEQNIEETKKNLNQKQKINKTELNHENEPAKLLLESSQLQLPSNYQTYACPLNVLLFHIGHHHNQHSHYNYHHQFPIYSYHNNYLHHNHYQHINNLQRGSISLMLLTELVCSDGADFDWTKYLPILFHFCLINFDNTKQLIGEHAKKLFLGLIYILTVQNELYYLTDYLIESLSSIIDNQSILYDRKYTSSNLSDSSNLILNNNAYTVTNFPRLSTANCHYNYNFNTKIFSANLKGHSNNLLANNISLMNSPSHRNLINMHSAPSSPSQNQTSQPSNQSSSKPDKVKLNIKKINKLQKAKEHLSILLNILSKCKNSPVWPHELITPHNYSKQLTSVLILNEFISNLKSFLHICFSAKQISTISSTRSFSSPLNLTTRFDSSEKFLNQIDKKWSHYALMTSLSTMNRHYAGRSLQIYRALGLKINSFSTMISLIHRLKDTTTDLHEDVQGYVTELLLTIKMNADILSNEYVLSNNSNKSDKTKTNDQNMNKQKSKSLKVKQEKLNRKEDFIQKKKSSTATGSELSAKFNNLEIIKAKTATLSRKQISQLLLSSKLAEQRLSTKFKHQISYRKCLTLSLFNYKWQILQERVGNSILPNRKNSKFLSLFLNQPTSSFSKTQTNDNLRLLVQIFWTSICLLESDFEHEFVLAVEIIEQILSKIDLNTPQTSSNLLVHKNEFKTSLELFSFRINWPNFPGLQNLLMKGCTSQSVPTIEATQRLLVNLIPYCSKLNFVDPFGSCFYGLWGLSMNLLSLLPTMILFYENPNDLCIKAAEQYTKTLKEQIKLLEEQPNSVKKENNNKNQFKSTKIEQLKNLNHVINLYMNKTFGKDKHQWTKCVITYMSEFFQQCQLEQNNEEPNTPKSNYYFNWIVFLIELLEKSSFNNQYQSCVLICLSSLLNYIDFSDQAIWSFINEELLRVVVKFINTNLWNEVLDLIKLTVSKSSSLISLDSQKPNSPRFFLNEASNTQVSTSQVPSSIHSFSGKKELPGRTLDFEFDFSLFIPSQSQLKSNQSPTNKPIPYLHLLSLHTNKQYSFLNQYLGLGLTNSKKQNINECRARDKLSMLYNTLAKHQLTNNQTNDNSSGGESSKTSLQKSPSVIFENSLNNSENQKENQIEQNDQEDNLNIISNSSLNLNNISDNAVSNQKNNSKSANNSTTADSNTSSTTSSSSGSNTNQTSSTNSSFNQTLFIFSPEKDSPLNKKPEELTKFLKPTLPAKQQATNEPHRNTHNRANSVSITKPGSIVNTIRSGMNTYSGSRSGLASIANIVPGVSQQILNLVDDNNFINNTFSFLDDLESNSGDYLTDIKDMNLIIGQKEDNTNINNSRKNLSIDNNYENFPWHAILPVNDQQDKEVSNEKETKSKTLPVESSTEMLSNSFTSSNNSQIFSINSKTKPIAPKIKGSATIGVSSGLSALKTINNLTNSLKPHDSIDGSTKQEFQSDKSIDSNEERKRSVTRIVSSDSISNTNRSLLPNSQGLNSQIQTNSLLNSNVIYDHNIEQQKLAKAIKTFQLTNYQPALIKTSPNLSPTQKTSLDHKLNVKNEEKITTLPTKPNNKLSLSNSNLQNSSLISLVKVTNNQNEQSKEQILLAKTIKNIYNFCLPLINIINTNQDEIEEIWKLHIQTMLNNKIRTNTNKLELSISDSDSEHNKSINPLETFYLFKKLFKETRHKLDSLLSECYHYLSKDTKLFLRIEKHLVIILDLINNKLDCPVVYFDQEWFLQQQQDYLVNNSVLNKSKSQLLNKSSDSISSLSFIENHIRILWEIGENYDTFIFLKHDVTECLDLIKKLEKISNNLNSSSTNEINSKIERFFKKIDLSKKFSKLISQFMILLQSFSKLLPNLTKNLENLTITDQSSEMSRLKKNLINALRESENNGRLSPIVPINLDQAYLNKLSISQILKPNSKELFIFSILESIRQENYTSALEYFKLAQKHWPNEFNKSNQTPNDLDFDLILLLACEHARLKNSNLVAIIESEEDFNEISQHVLMENIEITNLVNSIDKRFKENISSVLNDDDDDIE